MTDEDLAELVESPDFADALAADLCRQSFKDFVKEFWSVVIPRKLQWNWHMTYICDLMQEAAERVFRGENKKWDCCINISPGTSKSTICSVMFPAWVWTRKPEARFICCSFTERPLALKLSRYCRDVVRSEKYRRFFPAVELRADQDTKVMFANTKGGERYAVGSGGSVVGNHADFVIIDDPIDPEAVLSEIELERVNNWIEESLSSRLTDKDVSVTFLIMQRLGQDDPAGRMLQRKRVKSVVIPATTEYPVNPPELKKFYVDGLMDPVRLTRRFLRSVEDKPRGPYLLAGQYGQQPSPPGGNMFRVDLIRHDEYPPNVFKTVVRFWDKAGVMSKSAAYTVGLKMAKDALGRIWILDVKRFKLDSFSREIRIVETSRQDGRGVIVGVEMEPGSGGLESAQGTARRLAGLQRRVRSIKPDRDKERRADEFSTEVNAGNVYVSRQWWNGAAWVGWAAAYVEELKFFPVSTYKDQVDASSGAYTVITRCARRVGGMKPRERKSR